MIENFENEKKPSTKRTFHRKKNYNKPKLNLPKVFHLNMKTFTMKIRNLLTRS